MHYTPAWVKRDAKTYRRVRGDERDVLSPLCAPCREADARAFAALMRHLRSIDEAQRTVILVQVENECGHMGLDRDYAEDTAALFRSAVPPALMEALAAHPERHAPALAAAWNAAGRRKAGTWSEVFGDLDAEAFSAWHVARYVDAVAAAGKAAYPLPMYVNAWLITPGDERAGRWPGGGPSANVLDVWKAAAPHIDLLAPDFYQPKVEELSAAYARPDNALFVPEIKMHPYYAAFTFPVLARFGGLGIAPFGVETAGKGAPPSVALVEFSRVYGLLRPLLPLLARHQGTGRLRSFVQDADPKQVVRVGPRVALVASFAKRYDLEAPLGGGLVLEMAPDDLVIAGMNVDVGVRDLHAPLGSVREAILSIDEGRFDGERWIPARRLNGDERRIRLGPEGGILRVKLHLP